MGRGSARCHANGAVQPHAFPIEVAVRDHQLALPSRIVLTHYHPDHAPGIKQLVHWHAEVFCHPLEEKMVCQWMPPESSLSLLQGEAIFHVGGRKVEVIHSPGHTPGHIALWLPEEQILLAGDNLVAEGTTWIGQPDGDMKSYLLSLEKLKALKAVRIGPGHGDWISSPDEHIAFVIGRRLQREQEILLLLKEKSHQDAEELTRLIYKDSIHPSIFEVARRTIEAHLAKLIGEGKVMENTGTYSLSEKY